MATNKINRKTFLKQSVGLGAMATLFPFSSTLLSNVEPSNQSDTLFKRLVQANDGQVAHFIEAMERESQQGGNFRGVGRVFTVLAAAFCAPSSKYYQSDNVAGHLDRLSQFLLDQQGEDGTMNFGNLQSPPDTGFLLENMCAAVWVLEQNRSRTLKAIKEKVKTFILKAAEALVTGGVHTANHRWVICAALAQINDLYPNSRYVTRIDQWLNEGVYIDADGHFAERSRNYSIVIDRALISVSRLLNRPELLVPVKKNLEMTYYYMEPNGELVTNDSRRQDQFSTRSIMSYYLAYRFMAIHQSDAQLAGIAKVIEGLEGFEEAVIKHSLIDFMYIPLLQKELPNIETPPVRYEKLFSTTDLARIREGNSTLTLFGGVDWPLIIASGRSTSANFFAYRKGEAIMKYMRMSAAFFSTGYFRSEGLRKVGDSYVLYKKMVAPYYQPLPEAKQNKAGEYKHSQSTDGRFWNLMDFENRPVSNVQTLEYEVTMKRVGMRVMLSFSVTGVDNIPVTLEMCFAEGGKFENLSPAGDSKGQLGENYFLDQDSGRYRYGNDTIQLGPGLKEHSRITRLDGEMYSSHFGSLRTDGMFAYVTGNTPFKYTLTLE